MNDISKQLVDAAAAAMAGDEAPDAVALWRGPVRPVVAAVLSKLADLMEYEDIDEEWPDSGDLNLLAEDIWDSTLAVLVGGENGDKA